MEEYASILKNGGVGVIPTDTLYGLVASALSETAVERVYALRKRDADKPCIILIHSISDLELFGVGVTEELREQVGKFWPGKVSIIFPVALEKFAYLHRGTQSLAFRLPDNPSLISLLEKVDPLIAPSANVQGSEPAKTIDEAKNYFGEHIDFYEDGGELSGQASAVITFENGTLKVIRDGEALHTDHTGK